MILAGDIGASKTDIGLFRMQNGLIELEHSDTYPSRKYAGLPALIKEFIDVTYAKRIEVACFGVAGPVIRNSVETTNLAWKIAGHEVAQETGLSSVILINDLVATGEGVGSLRDGDMEILRVGEEVSEDTSVVVAAGTGLGMALLLPVGGTRLPIPSEGGHIDFAPRNEEEIELFKFLQRRFEGHVSVERVVSGLGLRNIYDYLAEKTPGAEDPDVRRELEASDAARVISEAALADSSDRPTLCKKALDMFVSAYGAAAGNLALLGKALGGVYLGGGITPKIRQKLRDGTFEKAFLDKGRFRSFLERVPVRIILNAHTAMLGAAHYAARSLATSGDEKRG
jgi:glucokinase